MIRSPDSKGRKEISDAVSIRLADDTLLGHPLKE